MCYGLNFPVFLETLCSVGNPEMRTGSCVEMSKTSEGGFPTLGEIDGTTVEELAIDTKQTFVPDFFRVAIYFPNLRVLRYQNGDGYGWSYDCAGLGECCKLERLYLDLGPVHQGSEGPERLVNGILPLANTLRVLHMGGFRHSDASLWMLLQALTNLEEWVFEGDSDADRETKDPLILDLSEHVALRRACFHGYFGGQGGYLFCDAEEETPRVGQIGLKLRKEGSDTREGSSTKQAGSAEPAIGGKEKLKNIFYAGCETHMSRKLARAFGEGGKYAKNWTTKTDASFC